MKVTVCELRNESGYLEQDWQELIAHVKSEGSDLVVLPEMPFYPWIARGNQIDDNVWKASVEAHDRWIPRLTELETALVISTRPIIRDHKRFNEGFVWDSTIGYKGVHKKYYLPDEEGYWEECLSWGEQDYDFSQISKKCTLGVINEPPSFILWGDSHAEALASAINASALKTGATGYIISGSGCPALLDVNLSVMPYCYEHNNDVLAYIEEHPEIETVIIVGRFALNSCADPTTNE